jgi:hypothetical protein
MQGKLLQAQEEREVFGGNIKIVTIIELLKIIKLSRYGDWQRAGRLRDRSSSPGRI